MELTLPFKWQCAFCVAFWCVLQCFFAFFTATPLSYCALVFASYNCEQCGSESLAYRFVLRLVLYSLLFCTSCLFPLLQSFFCRCQIKFASIAIWKRSKIRCHNEKYPAVCAPTVSITLVLSEDNREQSLSFGASVATEWFRDSFF